jgi:hypothetical protein
MALPSRQVSTSDIAFFRKTGLALILGTLVAGAITISLTLTQNQPIVFAEEMGTKAPMQLAAASVAMPLQEVSHE